MQFIIVVLLFYSVVRIPKSIIQNKIAISEITGIYFPRLLAMYTVGLYPIRNLFKLF